MQWLRGGVLSYPKRDIDCEVCSTLHVTVAVFQSADTVADLQAKVTQLKVLLEETEAERHRQIRVSFQGFVPFPLLSLPPFCPVHSRSSKGLSFVCALRLLKISTFPLLCSLFNVNCSKTAWRNCIFNLRVGCYYVYRYIQSSHSHGKAW